VIGRRDRNWGYRDYGQTPATVSRHADPLTAGAPNRNESTAHGKASTNAMTTAPVLAHKPESVAEF